MYYETKKKIEINSDSREQNIQVQLTHDKHE